MRARDLAAALCAAALVLTAGPAWSEQPGKPDKQDARDDDTEKVSAEDKEMIEQIEMLKHIKFFQDNGDMDMLLTLDVLTANE